MERVPTEPPAGRCATTESPCEGISLRGFVEPLGAMLEPGTAPLVVIGIDIDAEAIESVAEHAREHTLKREFGDWDAAEHDALESIARAEQQAVMP
jgi:hypothetical protein